MNPNKKFLGNIYLLFSLILFTVVMAWTKWSFIVLKTLKSKESEWSLSKAQ